MARTIHNQYLEAEVLGADPVTLVSLLYRGAIDAVRDARRHLEQGAIRERSKQIGKAWRILQELAASLNRDHGRELCGSLAGLYAYMQARLMEANSRQLDGPLQEVEGLLTTLSEAWQNAAKSYEADPATHEVYGQTGVPAPA